MAATAVLLTALFATAIAQTAQVTWAAVVFTYHGEKVPDLYPAPYYLTPFGANQLLEAGQTIRETFIDPPKNSTISAVINGISENAIDNSQLYILGTDDTVISQSMVAFMQGLYPPRPGPTFDQYDQMSDSTLEQYPLEGYQYPAVSSVSDLDFNYISVDGNAGCTTNEILTAQTLSADSFVQEVVVTSDFYTGLNTSMFSAFPTDILNYGNAWDLYEYALFQYNHNSTFHNDSSTFTLADLELLQSLASSQQWTFNTPSGNSTIQAMAGRTLASKVLEQFSHNIASSGAQDKLTLLFGTYEPFLSFFALSDLSTGPSAGKFVSLPMHGATMTFELFSYTDSATTSNEDIPFPDISELMVRFRYKNGTADVGLYEYSLFNRGNQKADMSWTDFVQGMGEFSLNDLVDWCTECSTSNLFCQALEENQVINNPGISTGSSKGRDGVSAVVAGVIGAAVTIALLLLVVAVLMIFGFRLEQRGGKNDKARNGDLGVLKRSISGNGGFKGAEKLASDTDLRLKGAGATIVRHERVGSWELNENSASPRLTSLDKEIESEGATSHADYDNGRHSEDGFGEPVKALEHV